jgi:hypothetical protein
MGGNRELAERFIASLETRDRDARAGLVHPAVVCEIPRSRERIRGRDRCLRFNRGYPGDRRLRPEVTIAGRRRGAVRFEWLLDGRAGDAVAFFEFAGGLIARVTGFWPGPCEPPPGRGHLAGRWLPAPRSGQPSSTTHRARRSRPVSVSGALRWTTRASRVVGADVVIHTEPGGPPSFQDHQPRVAVTNVHGQNTGLY